MQDKGYIDNVADIAATLLTTFNDVHKLGAGIDNNATSWMNFFGRNSFHSNATGSNYTGERYTWHVDPTTGDRWMTATGQQVTRTTAAGTTTVTTVDTSNAADIHEMRSMQIINALKVSDELTAQGGQNLVAARQIENGTITGAGMGYTYATANVNGTGDGTNAVELSKLFNVEQYDAVTNPSGAKNPLGTERPINNVSINQYYNGIMSHLGANAENVDKKLKQQDDLITQIEQWRQSTSGVDWNEELTNMLKFQTGYGACSRVLTSMDEMLDRLINSTGVVGR